MAKSNSNFTAEAENKGIPGICRLGDFSNVAARLRFVRTCGKLLYEAPV